MTMKFNPYTGHERHPADIETDPEGLLIEDPDKPVYAARTAVDQVAQRLVRKARVLDHYINPQRRGEVFIVRDSETGSLLAYSQPGNASDLLTAIVRRTPLPQDMSFEDEIEYESYKGFEAAFYEIAEALCIPAMSMSPAEVHTTKIMPLIKTLMDMHTERKNCLGTITPAIAAEPPPAPEPNPWYVAVCDAMKAIGMVALPSPDEDPIPALTLLLDLTADSGTRPVTPTEAVNAWNALMQIAREVDLTGPKNIMGNVKVAMEAQYQSGLYKGKLDAGMTPLLQLIAAERAKQIAKGYTYETDSAYGRDTLSLAAVSYALPVFSVSTTARGAHWGIAPDQWPWDERAWRPEGEGRNLIKAVALLIARLEVIGIENIAEAK